MMRRVPLLATLLLAAGCSGKVDFEIRKQFTVDSPVAVFPAVEQPVDLSQDAPDAWKHRGNIKSLDVHSADVVVTLNAGNAATQIVSGAMKMQLDCAGTPVVFASIANAPLVNGGTIALAPTAEGNQALNDALRGTGKFCWSLEGQADAAPVKFTGDATIRMTLEYSTN